MRYKKPSNALHVSSAEAAHLQGLEEQLLSLKKIS